MSDIYTCHLALDPQNLLGRRVRRLLIPRHWILHQLALLLRERRAASAVSPFLLVVIVAAYLATSCLVVSDENQAVESVAYMVKHF